MYICEQHNFVFIHAPITLFQTLRHGTQLRCLFHLGVHCASLIFYYASYNIEFHRISVIFVDYMRYLLLLHCSLTKWPLCTLRLICFICLLIVNSIFLTLIFLIVILQYIIKSYYYKLRSQKATVCMGFVSNCHSNSAYLTIYVSP